MFRQRGWGAWRKAIRSSCASIPRPVDKYGSVEATLSDFYEVNIDAHSALIPLRGRAELLPRLKCASPPRFTDPDKKKRMLMGGMTVNADIVIDRKPLINLLIAPLERVRKRFID